MSLVRDVRFALRGFRLAPAAAFVTAVTIAIGVGATTTVLSVANTLLLKAPDGVRETGSLVTAHAISSDGSGFHSFSWPDWRDLSSSKEYVEDLAGYSGFPASLLSEDEPGPPERHGRVIELFPDAANPPCTGPVFRRRGRRGAGRTAGHGAELVGVAEPLRRRPGHRRASDPAQRTPVHDHRSRGTWIPRPQRPVRRGALRAAHAQRRGDRPAQPGEPELGLARNGWTPGSRCGPGAGRGRIVGALCGDHARRRSHLDPRPQPAALGCRARVRRRSR